MRFLLEALQGPRGMCQRITLLTSPVFRRSIYLAHQMVAVRGRSNDKQQGRDLPGPYRSLSYLFMATEEIRDQCLRKGILEKEAGFLW